MIWTPTWNTTAPLSTASSAFKPNTVATDLLLRVAKRNLPPGRHPRRSHATVRVGFGQLVASTLSNTTARLDIVHHPAFMSRMTASDDGDEISIDPGSSKPLAAGDRRGGSRHKGWVKQRVGSCAAPQSSGSNRYSKVTQTAAISPGGRLRLESVEYLDLIRESTG